MSKLVIVYLFVCLLGCWGVCLFVCCFVVVVVVLLLFFWGGWGLPKELHAHSLCVWACLSIETEDFNKVDPGVWQSDDLHICSKTHPKHFWIRFKTVKHSWKFQKLINCFETLIGQCTYTHAGWICTILYQGHAPWWILHLPSSIILKYTMYKSLSKIYYQKLFPKSLFLVFNIMCVMIQLPPPSH